MNKKFISWRRVSTFRQNKSGLGLEAQKEIIRYFVERDKGELIADYEECYTGKELSGCKELRKAMNHAKREHATLIIAKSDRFRNTAEALQIYEEMGDGNIMFCDLPMSDKFSLTLFFALAEREALLVSIRTKQALAVKKAQGCKLGASNENYRKNYNNKTYVEKMEAKRKMGATKCARNLASQEKQAFFKILRRVFPDATQGDIHDWDWTKINSKGKTRPQMLALMESVHDVNPVIFRRFDFSDLESVELQKRLSGYICNLRRAVFKDKDFNETNNQ